MAQRNAKSNIADLSKGTRAKLLASVKKQIAGIQGTLQEEIGKLNANASRPIHRVNDLAGESVGSEYLEAPENVDGEDRAWAIQLGHLLQDLKQVERRILRTERMAKG